MAVTTAFRYFIEIISCQENNVYLEGTDLVKVMYTPQPAIVRARKKTHPPEG
jgi:hypothetical protein